jgi:hypothetical protein
MAGWKKKALTQHHSSIQGFYLFFISNIRQLKSNFGDKEAGLNAYVEGIVKGSVKPIGADN